MVESKKLQFFRLAKEGGTVVIAVKSLDHAKRVDVALKIGRVEEKYAILITGDELRIDNCFMDHFPVLERTIKDANYKEIWGVFDRNGEGALSSGMLCVAVAKIFNQRISYVDKRVPDGVAGSTIEKLLEFLTIVDHSTKVIWGAKPMTKLIQALEMSDDDVGVEDLPLPPQMEKCLFVKTMLEIHRYYYLANTKCTLWGGVRPELTLLIYKTMRKQADLKWKSPILAASTIFVLPKPHPTNILKDVIEHISHLAQQELSFMEVIDGDLNDINSLTIQLKTELYDLCFPDDAERCLLPLGLINGTYLPNYFCNLGAQPLELALGVLREVVRNDGIVTDTVPFIIEEYPLRFHDEEGHLYSNYNDILTQVMEDITSFEFYENSLDQIIKTVRGENQIINIEPPEESPSDDLILYDVIEDDSESEEILVDDGSKPEYEYIIEENTTNSDIVIEVPPDELDFEEETVGNEEEMTNSVHSNTNEGPFGFREVVALINDGKYCKICSAPVRKNIMDMHVSKFHSNNRLKCLVPTCKASFSSRDEFVEHKQQLHGPKEKTCKDCPFVAPTLHDYHLHLHSFVCSGTICDHCATDFKTRYGLRRHRARKSTKNIII